MPICSGFDAVVHLAELSNDPLGQHRPEVTYAINGDGSAALARLAKQAGVRRFVYSSSCSVYGTGNGEWKTETSPTQALTAYAACKLRTEAVLGALADDRFSPTMLRNATAYGASPRMRFDIVLNQFAGFAWTTGTIVMNSDGSPWRPLVHALDIAEAFACALEAPIDAVHNQIFNVGCNEENYRVRDIAEIVAAAFPGSKAAYGPSNNDGRSYRVVVRQDRGRTARLPVSLDCGEGRRGVAPRSSSGSSSRRSCSASARSPGWRSSSTCCSTVSSTSSSTGATSPPRRAQEQPG